VFFAQIGYVIDEKEVFDMTSMFSESFWAIAVFVVYALALLVATAYVAHRKRSVTVRDGRGAGRDH
jgi:ABC-type multidrug transport system permease subunit